MKLYGQELSEEKVIELINSKYESDSLDFKETFDMENDKKSYLELIKDIVAFANTEGGYIIYGIQDETYNLKGVKDNIIIKPTQIDQYLVQYVDEHITFVVSNHVYNKLKFIIIYIEKLSKTKPAIFKKDGTYRYNNKDSNAFKASKIYVRKSTKSEENLGYWFELKKIKQDSINLPNYNFVDNLPKPNYGENFVGRETDLNSILAGILEEEHTYRILIHGIGGLGKTALAQKVAYILKNKVENHLIDLDYIFWISAKNEQYTVSKGIKSITQDLNTIQDVLHLLAQLLSIEINEMDIEDQKELLKNALKTKSGILIIDNWETVKDINDELLDFLLKLPGKNKIIITSRYKIVDQQFKNLSPSPMINEEGIQFLKKWIENFNDISLLKLSDETLKNLAEAAGGIPIAMIMAIGQVSLGKPINDVINDLSEYDIDDPLLDFCFRETYKMLNEIEQKILLSLTFFTYPIKKQIITSMTELRSREISQGIQHLVKHSFIDISITDEPDNTNLELYSINPITKSFLKQQLISVPKVNEILSDNFQVISIEMENISKIEISSMKSVIEKLDYVTYEDKLAASFAASATRVWKTTKDWNEALKKFEKACTISPHLGYIYGQWAWVCENAGNITLARENYHKAVQLDENNIKLWYQWAMFELLKGDYLEAEHKFTTVLNKTPDDARSWHGLARVQIKKHENKQRQNLNDIIKLLERGFIHKTNSTYSERKHNSVNNYYLAKLYFEKRNFPLAIKYVNSGLKEISNDNYLLNLKNRIIKESKNHNENTVEDVSKHSFETINGKIENIVNFGAFIVDSKGIKYFVHISNVSNRYINDINEYIHINQNVEFVLIKEATNTKLAEVKLI